MYLEKTNLKVKMEQIFSRNINDIYFLGDKSIKHQVAEFAKKNMLWLLLF
jgi:hypothetical protein